MNISSQGATEQIESIFQDVFGFRAHGEGGRPDCQESIIPMNSSAISSIR